MDKGQSSKQSGLPFIQGLHRRWGRVQHNRRHLRKTKEDTQDAQQQDLIAKPVPRMTSDAHSYTTDPVPSPTRELPQQPQEQLPP